MYCAKYRFDLKLEWPEERELKIKVNPEFMIDFDSPQVSHGVAEALHLHCAELIVHGKVGKVHVTCCFYRQSETGAILREISNLMRRGSNGNWHQMKKFNP